MLYLLEQDYDRIGYEDIPYVDLGDVNGDGAIHIQDIVLGANIILEDNYNEIADLNKDGELNILDIVNVGNIILNP